jgi:UDP-glucose 4-epimerase
MQKTILVTGGLGYIGSHTVVELINEGFNVIIVDNLCNSSISILDRIKQITSVSPVFYKTDLCDSAAVKEIFSQQSIDAVIHFAAFKSVSESVKEPLKYFQNNLVSLMNVLDAMQENAVRNIVFSSSATVYGQPENLPATEQTVFQKALSAYGSTKQMGEEILEKITSPGFIQTIALRYFNPVGAHPSALIGELPLGVPNNLMPLITQTAIGKYKELTVYGNDYNTPDGTCIRDYIHVVDLAKAHVKSCNRLVLEEPRNAFEVFNIGSGRGISVLELIHCFEKEANVKLQYTIGSRRPGDAAAVYADVQAASGILKWKAEKGLKDIVTDAWRWERAVE